ncbi:MAG: hypothetical protein A2289_18665 [Deltaproteobacteria bacterium RIFOXYA12_FULL_58_15]|nr:MAG: hypothetical protein A2289_18665 [Deltaproteobacteria bacterium RIFOXYA12_FULL_58_15]OGR12855.1 MAG: hypothetical protein A2341_22020 [Deltaproteobacteria bacterium RIFOXYB12_FULL_58_9]
MTDPLDELPEIQIEAVLDEPSDPTDAGEAGLPEIDIDLDFDGPPPVIDSPAPTPPAASRQPLPPTRDANAPTDAKKRSATASLDLDALLSDIDFASATRPRKKIPTTGSSLGPAVPPLNAMDKIAVDIDLDHTSVDNNSSPRGQMVPELTFELEVNAPKAPQPPEQTTNPEESAVDDFDLDFGGPPVLPLSADEPSPLSTIPLETMAASPETIDALRKLAGPGSDPVAARAALFAALKGEPHNEAALPDTRAIALGLARVLVATGFSINEIADAIIEALTE